MKTSAVLYEGNKPYIIEGTYNSGNPRRRYGEIRICKECGDEFFTYRKKDFCTNHCSMKYQDVKSSRVVGNETVFFTETGCFVRYQEGKYIRNRFGEVKTCKYCGEEFYTSYGCDFCSKVCAHSKENHYNWKGGERLLPLLIRSDPRYYVWRDLVYKRDNYTCQICKDKTGGNLVAHHIVPMNQIIISNNLKTFRRLQCAKHYGKLIMALPYAKNVIENTIMYGGTNHGN
jgi:hypothetical protein